MTNSWRLRCKQYPNLMFGKALSNAKKRSLKRGVPYQIDKEYLMELYDSQSGKCYYSGLPLHVVKDESAKVHDHFKMTLDCIDPLKGYIKGNVVWCSYCVNSFKLNMSKDEMLKVCISILNNNNIKI